MGKVLLASFSPAAVKGLRLLACGASLALLAAPSLPQFTPYSQGDDLLVASSPQVLAREVSKFTLQDAALLKSDGRSAQVRNAAIPIASAFTGNMAPFAAMSFGSVPYQTALGCMTEAIYYEAANESLAGKRAVAQVILNRVAHPAYPSSVCGVIYQGWQDPVCQFSYTCDGSLARPHVAHLWRQSRDVAKAALTGYVEKSVGTATHYHADYVLPYWAYRLDKVHVEGRHIFYRLPGRPGLASYFTVDWRGREFHPTFDLARFKDESAQDLDSQVGLAGYSSLPRDPTERRADNDVGGRMDPASGWQLAMPDLTTASNALRATLKQQGTQPTMSTGSDGSDAQ